MTIYYTAMENKDTAPAEQLYVLIYQLCDLEQVKEAFWASTLSSLKGELQAYRLNCSHMFEARMKRDIIWERCHFENCKAPIKWLVIFTKSLWGLWKYKGH